MRRTLWSGFGDPLQHSNNKGVTEEICFECRKNKPSEHLQYEGLFILYSYAP